MSKLRWAVNCTQWKPTKQEWLSALSCLQSEEVERVGRFVYQRDSKLTLVGRLLIRAALSLLLGLHNDEIHLARSERGKPLLIRNGCADNRVGFNISHQGDFSVLAAQTGTAVGVDVMQFSKPRGTSVSEFFHTMRRQFTRREWDQIEQPHTEQLSNFYRFWCLKESFIKAEGSGLSYGLQNLEFRTDPSLPWPPHHLSAVYQTSQLLVGGKLMNEWTFTETLLDGQHCVAVATQIPSTNERGKATDEGFTQLKVAELLDILHTDQQQSDWSAEHMDKLWTNFACKKNSPQCST